MSNHNNAFAIACLLVTSSCGVHAQSDSEQRSVPAFSRLSVEDGIDVFLTQGDEQRLRVEVEGYELADVVTEVEGEQLRIYRRGPARRGFLQDNDMTVYLDFVELEAIDASSGSDIRSRNELELERLRAEASSGSDLDLFVRAGTLEFLLSGGSDLEIRGDTRSLDVQARGGSDVSARSLNTERARLVLAGGSDATVSVSGSVDIDAHGGSDVTIHGNPGERTVNNDRSSDIAWR